MDRNIWSTFSHDLANHFPLHFWWFNSRGGIREVWTHSPVTPGVSAGDSNRRRARIQGWL